MALINRSPLDPARGILIATGVIVVVAGARVIGNWDEISLWSDPGLFAALLVGGAALLLVALAYAMRRKAEVEIIPPARSSIEMEGRPEERRD